MEQAIAFLCAHGNWCIVPGDKQTPDCWFKNHELILTLTTDEYFKTKCGDKLNQQCINVKIVFHLVPENDSRSSINSSYHD